MTTLVGILTPPSEAQNDRLEETVNNYYWRPWNYPETSPGLKVHQDDKKDEASLSTGMTKEGDPETSNVTLNLVQGQD